MPEDAYRNLNEKWNINSVWYYWIKEAHEVQEAYEKAGFTLVERMTMKEWNCFVMKRM